MANQLFARLLTDYRARYPDVTLEVDLSGRLVNLVEEGFDLALRVTASPDSGLIARTIADAPFCFVPSRKFLDDRGRPTTLDDLQAAPLLAYSLVHGSGVVTQDTEQGRKTVKFTPILQSSNETLTHLACLEGMGYAFLPKWLISEDLASGRLEMVFPDKLFFAGRLLAVYPTANISRRRYVPSSTSSRAIRD